MNSIRCMSSAELFVGGLPFGDDECSLKNAFSCFGEVVEARIITDRDTGKSRGFGFVNFADAEAARSALSAMDGQLNGRSIRVSVANERSAGPRFNDGGYRGGESGYGHRYQGGGYGGQSNNSII